MNAARLWCGCLLGLFAGCSGGADGSDAALGDASVDAVVDFVDIPWLEEGVPPIAIAPCPEGWREVDADGVTSCEPYPEAGAMDCPRGEAHFPGEPECALIGSPCPAGDFSEELPADTRVVYIRPGATGGDGTAALPYGAVTEFSVGSLPFGAVIALSRGRHESPVRLSRNHVLWGACVAETIVTTSVPDARAGVITISSPGGAVRDLTVADGPRAGIHHLSSTDSLAEIEGVAVVGVQKGGLYLRGGHNVLRSILVEGTRADPATGLFGRGIDILQATGDLSRAVIDGNHDVGVIAALDGTVLTLSDTVIRDTQLEPYDGTGGRGLNAQDGAAVELSRALIERNREIGVHLGGGTLMVSDSIVRDTMSESDLTHGLGLGVESGSAAVSRVVIERNRSGAVFVALDDAMATLTDVVIRDTAGQESDGQAGRGLTAQWGATVDVQRVLLQRNYDVGVVGTLDAILTLTDVLVRDTRSQLSDEQSGRGAHAAEGSRWTLDGVVFEESREFGVVIFGPGTAFAATNTVVRGTLPRACATTTCPAQPAGHGVSVLGDGAFSLTRFGIEGSNGCGLQIARAGQADLRQGRVRGHSIGACIQVDGYDLGRLTTDVIYTDNDVNLQATELPVPDPIDPIDLSS